MKYISNDEIQKIANITLGNVKMFEEIEEKHNNGQTNLQECTFQKRKLKMQIEIEKMKSLNV